MVDLRRATGLGDLLGAFNRVVDTLLGNHGGRIRLIGDDGTARHTATNATTSTNNYALEVDSTIGNHIRVPSVATIQDAQIVVSVPLGAGVAPTGLAAGDVLLAGNLLFRSGQANALTFDHAITAARTLTFQDVAAGVVCVLNAANSGGHLLFVDNTIDIGASGATRPRHLFLAGNMVVPGTITVAVGGTGTATQMLFGGATPTWRAIATTDLAAGTVTSSTMPAVSTSGPTQTSSTYATIAEMEASVTTTTGSVLLATFSGSFYNSVGANNATIALALDGAAEVAPRTVSLAAGSLAQEISTQYLWTGLAAGAHTVRARWSTLGGTLTGHTTQRTLIVTELRA